MSCEVNVVKVWENNMKALGLPVPTDTYGAGLGALGAIYRASTILSGSASINLAG